MEDIDKLIMKLEHNLYYGDDLHLNKKEIEYMLFYCYYLKSQQDNILIRRRNYDRK